MKKPPVFVLLVSLGLSFVAGCSSPSLNTLIQSGQAAQAQKLIVGGSPFGEKDRLGNTPLHYSAQRADPALLTALLSAGADPNARNLAGETPLRPLLNKAGYYPDVTALLLDRGADPNIADHSGLTPLHFLASSLSPSLDTSAKVAALDALLAHGGDVNKPDQIGRTALHFAASTRPPSALQRIAAKSTNLHAPAGVGSFNAYTFAVIHGRRENAQLLAQLGLRPQLIFATNVLPPKAPPAAWEVNATSTINARAHDWYGAFLLEQNPVDSARAAAAFTTAREQYGLAIQEVARARTAVLAELPKAKAEFAAQKTKAIATGIVGTALGLVTGYNTGLGWTVSPAGGFSSQPDYLQWLLGEHERAIAVLQARADVLSHPSLLTSRELWLGRSALAPRGPWRDLVAVVTGYTLSLNKQPLKGSTVRDTEIKRAVDDFIEDLRSAGLFADVHPEVIPAGARRAELSLVFTEVEDEHRGAAAAKAAAAGFFTLGVAGNFTSGAYSYDSKVTVELAAPDAMAEKFSLQGTRTENYSNQVAGAGDKARKTARQTVTQQIFTDLKAQLVGRADNAIRPASNP